LNIVREAVSNALRHASARHIDVRLAKTPAVPGETTTSWTVSIDDDGRGFDRKQVNGHGRGLKNLMARAAELGGRSEITSRPGEGTRVVVEFAAPAQMVTEANPGDDSLIQHAPLPHSSSSIELSENTRTDPSRSDIP
jgi:nitrate/nitrite-specific signal transduction histidine kinase